MGGFYTPRKIANWYKRGQNVTRKYSLVMERGPSGLSGYVPELPTILVTGNSPDELADRASEAIKLYLAFSNEDRSPTAEMREIEIELPA